jgi:hypothetical protein
MTSMNEGRQTCEGTPPLAPRGISVIAHAGMAVPELQKRREEKRREEKRREEGTASRVSICT